MLHRVATALAISPSAAVPSSGRAALAAMLIAAYRPEIKKLRSGY